MGVNILDFNGKCPMCGKEIDLTKEYRDKLSIREYFISGLCQKCQDVGFAPPVESDAESSEEEKPKDYDIFCKNKAALTKVRQYFKENSCNYISENAITYGKYQFVTKWYGDAETEVGKFDFKHNMFYYDSEGLHNLVDWDFLNSNKLVFNKLRARDVASILTRIPKFVARGMEIGLDESAEMLDVITSPKNYVKERISIKRMKSKRRKSSY